MSSNWFAVRKELSPRKRLILMIMSFVLPLMAWSTISYCPYVWHPLVEITDAGSTSVEGDYDYIAIGQRVDKDVFRARNRELKSAGANLAQGHPANPIFLPPPP